MYSRVYKLQPKDVFEMTLTPSLANKPEHYYSHTDMRWIQMQACPDQVGKSQLLMSSGGLLLFLNAPTTALSPMEKLRNEPWHFGLTFGDLQAVSRSR